MKVIVMDMDGTLLNDDKKVTEYTKNVLRDMKKRGMRRCQTAKRRPAKPLPAPQSPIPAARPCGEQTAHCTEGLRQSILRRPERYSLLRPAVPG